MIPRTRKKIGKRFYTVILPDETLSQEEVKKRIREDQIRYYKSQMEKIRLSSLSEDQKRIQSSFIEWRLNQLIRERDA